MSEKEIATVVKAIRKNGRKISSDKAKSASFLKSLGILTKSGTVSKAYKEICTPIGQD
jgi:hypothetical protein